MAIRRFPAIVGLVLFLGCTALASVAEAAVAHVTCGEVITTNTTLASDVGPCEGDGIIIGADNIGLNLGGYSVLGSSSPGSSGIVVSTLGGTRSGVTVRNGTVTGFDAGVRMGGGSGNRAIDLVISSNLCSGISVTSAATDSVIRSNRIEKNGCAGVNIAGAGGTVVQANRITQNTGEGVAISRGSLSFATGPNTVSRNTIAGNGKDGVFLGFVSSQTISENKVLRNGQNGIRMTAYATANLVQGNIIRANALDGVVIEREPTFLHNNQVLGNTSERNRSFDLADLNDDCGGGTWAGNVFLTRNQPCIS